MKRSSSPLKSSSQPAKVQPKPQKLQKLGTSIPRVPLLKRSVNSDHELLSDWQDAS
jgi:hypothetical protein